MPLLAGLLTSLFSGIAGFFGMWLTKKAAFAVAAVGTFGVLTVGLYVALSAIVAGVVVAFPEGGSVVISLVWVALPDNAVPLVAACVATDTAVALYRWNVRNLELAAQVS